MTRKRFTIEMRADIELDELVMFADGEYGSATEALSGVDPIDMLGEWNLLPDLRVLVTNHATNPPTMYEHIGGGRWRTDT